VYTFLVHSVDIQEASRGLSATAEVLVETKAVPSSKVANVLRPMRGAITHYACALYIYANAVQLISVL